MTNRFARLAQGTGLGLALLVVGATTLRSPVVIGNDQTALRDSIKGQVTGLHAQASQARGAFDIAYNAMAWHQG